MARVQHSLTTFVPIVSILIVLLQSRTGNFAPTHHLKISVEGNTPTLIVTSSEIGITPAVIATTKSRNSNDESLASSTLTTTTTKAATIYTTTATSPTTTATITSGAISTTTLNSKTDTETDAETETETGTKTAKAKTAPSTPSPKWLHKNNQLKLKSKSLKSLYEKKYEKATKEKTTAWHGKEAALQTTALPVTPQVVARPKIATAALEVMKELNSITTTTSTTATTPAPTPAPVATTTLQTKTKQPAIEVDGNNEFKADTETQTKSEATISSTAHTLGKQVRADAADISSAATAATTIPASGATTLGKLPHQTQTPTSASSAVPTIGSNAETMPTTTTTALATGLAMAAVTVTAKSPIILNTTRHYNADIAFDNVASTITNADMKALPKTLEAGLNEHGKSESTTNRPTSTFVAELTPTATPVITTEATGATSNDVSTSSKTMPTTSEPNVITTETPGITDSTVTSSRELITTSLKTIPANVNDSLSTSRVAAAPTPNTTPTDFKTIIATAISTSTPTATPAPTSTATSNSASSSHDLTQHAVIKLIDLEKHEPISIDELRTKGRTLLEDGGHDGIKQTKKKQLLDKHFMLADTTTATDFEPNTETATTPSDFNTKNHDDDSEVGVGVGIGEDAGLGIGLGANVEKPTLITPTLMPVHNGYLGPIIMEERIFSVVPKTKAHEHVASIESKLHDGRIVEIIAPTALVEQDTVTTLKALESRIDSNGMPTTKPTVQLHEPITVLSTTVFQVPEVAASTTRTPVAEQQRESKISDIQIEVYDNVASPSSSNFQHAELKLGSTKPPALLPTTQERFTQYVVDRTESSTMDTPLEGNLNFRGIGKPEPAAIEIHINVSEGMPNQSEDLEFSYHQSENLDDPDSNATPLTSKPFVSIAATQRDAVNNERNDDILVVEIIDTGDNSTEMQSPSSDNAPPVFTFRADSGANIELKDIQFAPTDTKVASTQLADELFMADVKQNGHGEYVKPPIPPPPPPPRHSSTLDRDSDTIFYISNTEVKVGESSPNVVADEGKYENRQEELMRRARLENQFFPANYVASTHPNTAAAHQKHLYEEDIILSPVRNTADSLKIFRSQGDGAPPLDVTYVGESVIEVEQSSGAGSGTTTTLSATYGTTAPTQTPDVIIQPAVLPEMSIGVPVIGELPPQIELKEIDFMPNEANQQRSGVYESENNDIEENLSVGNNDVDRLVESSIQYGGDLIDEGADGGGGFDGVEGSYPFGNMAAMRRKAKNNGAADYAHFTMQHGVNNLRKDELSIDVATSVGLDDGEMGNAENATAFQSGNETTNAAQITHAVAKRIRGNSTAHSHKETPYMFTREGTAFKDNVVLGISIVLLLLLIAGTVYLFTVPSEVYSKLFGSTFASQENDVQLPNGNVGHGGDGGESGSAGNESDQPPSTNKDASPEHTPTTDRICLPVLADSTTKPSNNSNSLNIVNEKLIADNLANGSTDTPRTGTEPPDSQLNSIPESYAGPNGSVTKMTLKNNHLIVETEERNDISRDARETKMHYSTSDKDGVFVVEVARGIDSKMISESPIAEMTEERLQAIQANEKNGKVSKSPTRKYEDEPAVLNNHEQVQVHQPPSELHNSNTERSLHQIDEVEEETLLSPKPEHKSDATPESKLAKHANTGLSQSDLSSTSSTDSNKAYTYGNQELYTVEQTGYPTNSPTATNLTPKSPSASESKDDDQKSENGHNCELSPQQNNDNDGNVTEQNSSQHDKKLPEIVENEISAEKVDNHEPEAVNDNDKSSQPVEHSSEEPPADVPVVENGEETAAQENSSTELQLDTETGAAAVAIETSAPVEETELLKEITQDDCKDEERMSVSEAELVAESVTSETDITQKLNFDAVDKAVHVDEQAETDPEFGYDSLMSLPDPPTNEEMTQLNDFNAIETSQLDSLPPPPPSLLLVDENTNMPDIVAEIKSQPCQVQQTFNGNVEYCNGHGNTNGHELAAHNASTMQPLPIPPPPPPAMEEINSNRKMLPNSPLTPPESPPPSPPAQYSNGVLGINERLGAPNVHAVAVDVNGS